MADFLSRVAVEMKRGIVVLGFNGYDERVNLAVAEPRSQCFILVSLAMLYGNTFSGASQELGTHLRLFTKHQSIQCDVVTAGNHLQCAY